MDFHSAASSFFLALPYNHSPASNATHTHTLDWFLSYSLWRCPPPLLPYIITRQYVQHPRTRRSIWTGFKQLRPPPLSFSLFSFSTTTNRKKIVLRWKYWPSNICLVLPLVYSIYSGKIGWNIPRSHLLPPNKKCGTDEPYGNGWGTIRQNPPTQLGNGVEFYAWRLRRTDRPPFHNIHVHELLDAFPTTGLAHWWVSHVQLLGGSADGCLVIKLQPVHSARWGGPPFSSSFSFPSIPVLSVGSAKVGTLASEREREPLWLPTWNNFPLGGGLARNYNCTSCCCCYQQPAATNFCNHGKSWKVFKRLLFPFPPPSFLFGSFPFPPYSAFYFDRNRNKILFVYALYIVYHGWVPIILLRYSSLLFLYTLFHNLSGYFCSSFSRSATAVINFSWSIHPKAYI